MKDQILYSPQPGGRRSFHLSAVEEVIHRGLHEGRLSATHADSYPTVGEVELFIQRDETTQPVGTTVSQMKKWALRRWRADSARRREASAVGSGKNENINQESMRLYLKSSVQ